MLRYSIAAELKRRLFSIKNKYNAEAEHENGKVEAQAAPSVPPAQAQSQPSLPSESAPAHETTLQRAATTLAGSSDLLAIEIAALEHIAQLLERENTALRAVTERGASLEPPKELADALTANHDTVKAVNLELVDERKQTAVDLVDFVFRTLQARPPPRSRAESSAVRSARLAAQEEKQGAATAAAAGVGGVRGGSGMDPVGAGFAGGALGSPTLPPVPEVHAAAEASSDGSDAAPHLMQHTPVPEARSLPSLSDSKSSMGSSSVLPSPVGSAQSVRSSALERSESDLKAEALPANVARRVQRNSVFRPNEIFHVLKVNTFRRDSPHVLEIDFRTSSVTVRDERGAVKYEISGDSIQSARITGKRSAEVLFSYSYGKRDKPSAVQKRYRFRNADEASKFCALVENAVAKLQLVSSKRAISAGGGNESASPFASAAAAAAARGGDSAGGGSMPLPQSRLAAVAAAAGRASSVIGHAISTTPTSALSAIASAPLEHYQFLVYPQPQDTSNITLPPLLADIVDDVASNLLRLWSRQASKKEREFYQVDDSISERPEASIRNQVKLAIGPGSSSPRPFQNTAARLADAFLRDILAFGFEVQPVPSGAPAGEIAPFTSFSPSLSALAKKLAIDSHEVWGSLAARTHERVMRTASAPPGSQIVPQASQLSLVPGPQQQPAQPLPPPSDTQSDSPILRSQSDGEAFSGGRTPPRRSQAGSIAVVATAQVRGSFRFSPFEQLPQAVQEAHHADATEVLRTLFEFGLAVTPAGTKLPVGAGPGR